MLIVIVSPTSQPPVSSATFQFRSKSLRLILVWALKPALVVPQGVLACPAYSTESTTGLVMSRMVSSPYSLPWVSSRSSTRLLLKVIYGYFSTSRKSGERRCVSRRSSPVTRLEASICTSTLAAVGLFSSASIVPVNTLKRPRTVEIIRCLAENWISEWAGSITHAIGKLLCVTSDTLVSCSCAHSALPLLDDLEVLLLRFLGRLDTIELAVLRDLQPPMQAMNLIHEWPVEVRCLPIRLGSHQQEPSAFYSVRDRELTSPAQQDQLGRPGRAPSGTELSLAFQHVGEPLELRWDRCGDLPTCRQLDVEDQGGRPQMNHRAVAHQHPHRCVARVAHRDLLRLHHLCARLGMLVLAGQVHPEQHAAELSLGQALTNLVGSNRLGMPYTSSGPECQECALSQSRPLHRSAGPRAVARAGRTFDHVPDVIKPAVGMPGVGVGQVRQAQPRFVKKDEWVDLCIWHRAGGKCLQDGEAHHTDPRRILNQDGLSSGRLNVCVHVALQSFLVALLPDL